MPNTPNVNFTVQDDSQVISPPAGGLNGLIINARRGQTGAISVPLYSYADFQKYYGSFMEEYPDMLQAKIALDGGSKLRVINLAGTGAVGAVGDSLAEDATNGDLFGFAAKYTGADYNNVVISVSAASSGLANYFKLSVQLVGDSAAKIEVYDNLIIPGNPTAAESTYLDRVLQESKLVTPLYEDLSATTGQLFPQVTTIALELGVDGTVSDADYIAALPLFDSVEDLTLIAAAGSETQTFNTAIATYAMVRKDVIAIQYIGDSDDEDTLIATRNTLATDSRLTGIFCGKRLIANPLANSINPVLAVSIVGDILAASATTDKTPYGPWYSFVGKVRGLISSSLGVVNNFGTKAKFSALQKLASNQINLVVQKDGKTMLWHGFTSQRLLSKSSFLSISKLVIYVQKTVGPVYEASIEEPLDLVLVRKMFDLIDPFLLSLTTPAKRALVAYSYQGDQKANTFSDFTINDPVDFGLGKYKVKIRLDSIVPLQEVDIAIILDKSGVTYEVN